MAPSVDLVLQILLLLFGPALILAAYKTRRMPSWLSPVVVAYLIGILLATFPILGLDESISKHASEGSILIAIPLLLFCTNIPAWFKYAKSTVGAFIICIVAGLLATFSFAFIFKNSVPEIWGPAGMLVGVYTGGTPNMQAIGLAAKVPEEVFIILNATDLLWSGVYLIFLTSIGKQFLGRFLPAYELKGMTNLENIETQDYEEEGKNYTLGSLGKSIFLALLIVITTVGLTQIIFNSLDQVAFIMLLLTTLSVLASFVKSIRELAGSFEAGEYLLLIFCMAIGMRSDFGQLIDTGGIYILFTGAVLTLTLCLYYLGCWIFKIDRDTSMIVSTAAVFGPAFIGQIASVLKNRSIVFGGIATGLIGYAVGNYLGIAMVYLLKGILN